MWQALLQILLLCTLPTYAQSIPALAYAPTVTPCPKDFTLVREAGTEKQALSSGESEYVSSRAEHVLPGAWKTFLSSVQGTTHHSEPLPSYVSQILDGQHGQAAYPTLGFAVSGGGYRAAIFGAGVLNAFDARNCSSVAIGTGGLLQAATYLAGLSGGGWLVGSLVQADFPTIQDLVFGCPKSTTDEGWLANFDLLLPGYNAVSGTADILELVEEVELKAAEGFPVTVTDVWARALSRHFVNGTNSANFFDVTSPHGAGITFSSLAQLPTMANHAQPFPILITDSVSPFQNNSEVFNPSSGDASLTNPIYELNVFEMGSFDPMLSAFIPMEFLGTTNSSQCVTKYDQLSFVEGLSSSLFNAANTSAAALNASPLGEVIQLLEKLIPESSNIELDSGALPNPFFGVAKDTFIDSNQTMLILVDGGEDGETIPIQPLLVKARGVDVIVVVDAASDTTDNFTNGTSVIATQDRVALFPGTYSFPPVPTTPSEFLADNLTTRAVFFGCRSSPSSGDPFVVYIPNGGAPLGQAPVTNTSTNQLSFQSSEIQAMLSQIFDITTQGFPQTVETKSKQTELVKDPEWAACLACGVVDRSRRELGIARSGICSSCLSRYCWS